MSGLVGSAPSVKTTTQPTIDQGQQGLLSSLEALLGNQGIGGTLNFGQVQGGLTGQYGAPMSGLQTNSLAGIENLVNTYAGAPLSSVRSVTDPLNKAIGGVEGLIGSNPVSMIDPTKAFNQGVVQPLTDDFTQRVIPSISGQYGSSAGGTFSSDQQLSRQQAGTNLGRTLAQEGSKFTLQADEANQAAQAENAGITLSAAGLLPGLVETPLKLDLAQMGLLSGGLSAGAVPQQTQQTQLSGQFQDYEGILQQIQQRLADALGLGTASTQQTQSVVNPGQSGFLTSLLSALAGGAARGYSSTW